MNRSVKPTRKSRVKRDLFAELSEGMDALADARQGRRTLNSPDGIQVRARRNFRG